MSSFSVGSAYTRATVCLDKYVRPVVPSLVKAVPSDRLLRGSQVATDSELNSSETWTWKLLNKVTALLEPTPRRCMRLTTNDSRLQPVNPVVIEGPRTDLCALSDEWPPVCFAYAFGWLWFCHQRSGRLSVLELILGVFILAAVRESTRTVRWQSFSGWYGMLRTLLQFVGDLMALFPYYTLIATCEEPQRIYQNTAMNRHIAASCKSLRSFSPTPFFKHPYLAWTFVGLEEAFKAPSNFEVFRECLAMRDGGTVALDWVVPSAQFKRAAAKRKKDSRSDFQLGYNLPNGDWQRSGLYHDYSDADYEEAYSGGELLLPTETPSKCNEMAEHCDDATDGHRDNGDYVSQSCTPILAVFATFSGTGRSVCTRYIHTFFAERNWRCVVLVKRGGIDFGEMLPLTSARSFCFRSEEDTIALMQTVGRRFPNAPVVALGLSIGASLGGDYVALHSADESVRDTCPNLRGFVRIDGPLDLLSESVSFGQRQWHAGNGLCKIVAEKIVQPFWRKFEAEFKAHGFDLPRIEASNSFIQMVDEVMAKSHGGDEHLDWVRYLQSVKARDPQSYAVPTLFLTTWNDGFMHPFHKPLRVAYNNPHIVHCATVAGTHCFRREGLCADRCWLAALSFQFAEALFSFDHKQDK